MTDPGARPALDPASFGLPGDPEPRPGGGEPPTPRRGLIGIVIAAAIAIAIAGVVALTAGGSDTSAGGANKAAEPALAGVSETADLLRGLAQAGTTLGDPRAPVTVMEYIDLQCPFCAAHQREAQPRLVKELVRTGRAKITIVPLAFLGPDSVAGRNVFLRLAQRGLGWNFMGLVFFNQGRENSGYMTDDYLRSMVAAIPGASVADAARASDQTTTTLAGLADSLARAAITDRTAGTPYFTVGPSAADPRKYAAIDRAAAGDLVDHIVDAVRRAAPRGTPS